MCRQDHDAQIERRQIAVVAAIRHGACAVSIMLGVFLGCWWGAPRHVAAALVWNTSAGYPAPPSTAGVPGFAAFNDIFSILPSSNSTVLTSPDGTYDVGVEVNPAQPSMTGALWSNQAIFDLSQDEASASMYLYFGQHDAPGDGMAFALAGVRPTQIGGTGGTIGVWGPDGETETLANAAAVAAHPSTLKKSFVVTFDTYANYDRWDKDVWPSEAASQNQQYMGAGYPNQADTYRMDAIALKQRTRLNVNGTQQFAAKATHLAGNLADGSWHRFDVTWRRSGSGGTLTYQLAGVAAQTVTWTDAQINTVFGTQQLYLGFTGTTGGQFEANVVAFRALPGQVVATPSVTLVHGSDTVTADTVLLPGDQLRYQYTLAFDDSSTLLWPSQGTLTVVIHKGQEFDWLQPNGQVAAIGDEFPVTVDGPGGDSGATVTVTSATTATVTGITGFTDLTAAQRTFMVPAVVKKNTFTTTQAFTDPTGIAAGNNAQFDLLAGAGPATTLSYQIGPDPGALTLIAPNMTFNALGTTGAPVPPTVGQLVAGLPGGDDLTADVQNWLWQTGTDRLTVTDTRPSGRGWQLQVALSPLTVQSPGGPPYVLGNNGVTTGGQATVRLYTQTDTTPYDCMEFRDDAQAAVVYQPTVATPSWSPSAGGQPVQALMKIAPTPSVVAGDYTGTLTWTLADVPL